jgi:outer membrane lipoprotein carrier protein
MDTLAGTHRRTPRTWALLGVALLAASLPSKLQAQAVAAEASDARTVAARVQSFYDQTRDVSADFYQTYVNQLYKRTDRSQGKVMFRKPGMMRWDYAQPNGKVIASDGKRLVMYEPGEDGDKGQYAEQQVSEAQLPQAMSFLMGAGRLEESFTFRLLDAAKEGYPGGDVLELQPKQPTPHYVRILFYVERDPRLRGLVRRLLIIDESGNRNRFDFTALKFNAGVGEEPFRWSPPAGSRKLALK